MINYIFKRLVYALPVLFVVISATFFLIRMAPGGPFDEDNVLPQEVIEQLNQRYHLDKPIHQQFASYLYHLIQGDLGPSFRYANRSVNEMIAAGLPITLELACYAILIALTLGVSSGVIAALKPNSLQDYLPMSVAMLGLSIPNFLMGPLLVLVFGLWLEWLPVSGWGYNPGDKILPAVTLGTAYAAYIARLTRTGMLEILSQDFVRTAYAKGLPTYYIVIKHCLRGGLTPVVAFLGPALAGLIAGSFVVESIFQIPGLGRFYVQAAFNRDYTMIMGTTILLSTLIIFFNLLADIIGAWMNPNSRAI